MATSAYRDLLRTPSVGWLLGTSLVARMPNGMMSLALLLALTEGTGAYGRAGLVSAAYVVGSGVAQPFIGRAMDRHGRRRVLVPVAAANAGLVLALALSLAAPLGVLLGVAALAGATQPPVGAALRALWPVLLQGSRRQSVFALEATMQELSFIAGPAVVAGLAAVGGPQLALALVGVIALIGTLAFVRDPAVALVAGDDSDHPHRGGALRSRPLRRIMVACALLVAALSIVDVGVVAFISGSSASATAGVALAMWSAGSLVGGLLFGARKGSTPWRLRWLFLAVAAHFLLLAAAPGDIALVALLFIGGTTVAPTLATMYHEVGESVPERVATEAFTWVGSALLAGAAVGAAVGGWTVDLSGARWCFLLAAGLAVGGSFVVQQGRRARRADA